MLPGGVLGKEEVCAPPSFVNRLILSVGSAVVNANSTKAFRENGIVSIQGRCSNGKVLGYYGPPRTESSVTYQQENIQVGAPCQAPGSMSALRTHLAWQQ